MSKFLPSSSKIRAFFLLAFVVVIVCGAFFSTLQNDFVFWDDDVHLYENITLRSLDYEHVRNIFTEKVNKLYIPLTTLSFALEYHYFGYDPFIYHLNNLILHVGVVALIFWLGLSLGLSALGSALTALLFGIHPMHVESVAWVTERKDVLYALFYLAALLSYTRYLQFTRSTPSLVYKKSYRFLVATCFLGILSMLAKPMALSLPLILLLFDWFHGRKKSRGILLEKIPLCLGIAGITWVSYVAHARIPGKGVVDGILIFSWTFVFYLRQFLFPIILVPVYQLPKPLVFLNPEYGMSVIVVILFVIMAIRLRKHRWLIFSILFYVLSIFFLLRYDEAKDINIVADRFMYLPSLGFCFLVGYGCERVLDGKKVWLRYSVGTALGLLIVIGAVQTNKQVKIWDNSISLWQHQLKFYPRHPVALNNLAAALREQDEYKDAEQIYKEFVKVQKQEGTVDLSDEALRSIRKVDYVAGLYVKAIEVNPNFIDSHYNLGRLFADMGKVRPAIAAYKKALELDHTYKDVHFSLGQLYDREGDYQQAVFAYEQTITLNPEDEDVYVEVATAYNEALKINPRNTFYQQARGGVMDRFTQLINNQPPRATSFFNLGYLYGGMGDLARAVAAYQMVLDINPKHSNATYNLGNIYKDQGRLGDALKMYQKVIQSGAKTSDALLNVGAIYQRQGKQEQARESFQKAIQANRQNARAYFNLGTIEERLGNLSKALDLYQKSIDLDRRSKEAYYNLGNVYARRKENSKAIEAYLKAVDIDFHYVDAWINVSILSFKERDFEGAVKYCDKAVLLGYNIPQGYLNALAPHRKKASIKE